jgi:hypothetical protein
MVDRIEAALREPSLGLESTAEVQANLIPRDTGNAQLSIAPAPPIESLSRHAVVAAAIGHVPGDLLDRR